MALREPYVVDDGAPRPVDTANDEVPLVAVVSIVAIAAIVLAMIGAMVGGCSMSPDGGWILGVSSVAFVGACVVTYQRRTWAHAATIFTGVAFVFVIVGLADRTAESHRFVETGNACQFFESD